METESAFNTSTESTELGMLILRVTKSGDLFLYSGWNEHRHAGWTQRREKAQVQFDDPAAKVVQIKQRSGSRTPDDRLYIVPTSLYSAFIRHVQATAAAPKPGKGFRDLQQREIDNTQRRRGATRKEP